MPRLLAFTVMVTGLPDGVALSAIMCPSVTLKYSATLFPVIVKVLSVALSGVILIYCWM